MCTVHISHVWHPLQLLLPMEMCTLSINGVVMKCGWFCEVWLAQVYEAVPYKGGAGTPAPGPQAGAGHPAQPPSRLRPRPLPGMGARPQEPHPLHSTS